VLTQPEKTDGTFAARPAVDAGTTQRRLQQQSPGEAHAPQAVAAAAPLASTSRTPPGPTSVHAGGGAESGAGAAGFEPGDTDPVQCGRDPVCDGRCRPTLAAPERETHRPRGP